MGVAVSVIRVRVACMVRFRARRHTTTPIRFHALYATVRGPSQLEKEHPPTTLTNLQGWKVTAPRSTLGERRRAQSVPASPGVIRHPVDTILRTPYSAQLRCGQNPKCAVLASGLLP